MVAEPGALWVRALAYRDLGSLAQLLAPQLSLHDSNKSAIDSIGDKILQDPFRERIKLRRLVNGPRGLVGGVGIVKLVDEMEQDRLPAQRHGLEWSQINLNCPAIQCFEQASDQMTFSVARGNGKDELGLVSNNDSILVYRAECGNES